MSSLELAHQLLLEVAEERERLARAARFARHDEERVRQVHLERLPAAAIIEQHAQAHGIQLADALIGATAIESGLPLCTGNAEHFRPIRRLSRVTFHP